MCKLFGRASEGVDVLVELAGITSKSEFYIWAVIESVEGGEDLHIRECMEALRKIYICGLFESDEKVYILEHFRTTDNLKLYDL